jgi:hypothetical protein
MRGWGRLFEGDSAETCGGKFPLVSMGGQAEGFACADPGVRTPIGASRNFSLLLLLLFLVPLFKTPEGVVIGFQIFALAPK